MFKQNQKIEEMGKGRVIRLALEELEDLFFFLGGGVQTKMSWCRLLTSLYSRCPLGIKVQSCPVLR